MGANPLEEAVPKVKGMPITNAMDYRPPRKAPIAEESAAVARKLQVRAMPAGQTEAFEPYLQAQRANSEPLTSFRTSAATGCYGGTMPPVNSPATTRGGCALGSFERPRQDVCLREVEDDALNGDYLQHPVLVTQGNKILGLISIFI